jgi:FkbM family methyltransferase
MNQKTILASAKKSRLIRAGLFPFLIVKRAREKRASLLEQAAQDGIVANLRCMLSRDPVMRLPDFDGVFTVGVWSDQFKRLAIEGRYEPELARRCAELLDRTRDVIDVGANVGFFTVLFAKKVENRRVLAVEPTKNALERLHKNIRGNGVEARTIVFEGVASDKSGEARIKTVAGKEEYSSLGEMAHPGVINEKIEYQQVKASTVDELTKKYSLDPGLIKVDVEGMEHLVFAGAHEVLKNKRPVIVSELSDYLLKRNGSSAAQVIAALRQYDYEITDPLDPSVRPGIRDFGDIICVPR